jgi:hypothetical protein
VVATVHRLGVPTRPDTSRRVIILSSGTSSNNPLQRISFTKYECIGPQNKFNWAFAKSLVDITISTNISTDLKIAVVGDSIGYQLIHTLEPGMAANDTQRLSLFWTYRRVQEGLTMVTPVQGLGNLGFWRMTKAWLQKHKNQTLLSKGYGWIPQHGAFRLNVSNNATSMDAMGFLTPHGWIRGADVTKGSLNETEPFARSIDYWSSSAL